MAVLLIHLAVLATVLGSASADAGFDWIWPPPFGLDPTTMNVAPCGGFNASVTPVTNYLDQLRWNQTEQRLSFMARISTDLNDGVVNGSDTPVKWSQISAVQASLDAQNSKPNPAEPAQFCVHIEPPTGFTRNTTIFQLIADSPMGIIFACSRISFVSTVGNSYIRACPSDQGNGTITNKTEPALISAAALRVGQTATASSSTTTPTQTTVPPSHTPTPDHHLSKGAIAGIVIGSVVAFFVIFLVAWVLFQRSRKTAAAKQKSGHRVTIASQSSVYSSEMKEPSSIVPPPLPDNRPGELAGDTTHPSELIGDSEQPKELVGDYRRAELVHDPASKATSPKTPVARVGQLPDAEFVSPMEPTKGRWSDLQHSPVSEQTDIEPLMNRVVPHETSKNPKA